MNNISIIACTGPPRSKIDLLLTCFQALGFSSGNHIQPSPETIDNFVLQAFGQHALSFPYGWMKSDVSSRAKERIDKFISQARTLTDKLLYVKLHPLTLPLWLNVFQRNEIKVKIIHILRHPFEVALSLQANQNMELHQAHIVWLSQIRAALCAMEGQIYSVITLDQLLADPISTLEIVFGLLLTSDFHLFRETTQKELLQRILRGLQTSDLLEIVQPSLKHHHATDFPEIEKERFEAYAKLYDLIRIRHYFPETSLSELANPTHADMSNEGEICTDSCRFVTNHISSNLIDSLLHFMSDGFSQKANLSQLPNNKSQLTLRITFPSSKNESGITHTIPLIDDQWQKIELPVPALSLLLKKEIKINPLNTYGTVKISNITIQNKSTGKTLKSFENPQDFNALKFTNDLYRMVDLYNLVLLVTGERPEFFLPKVAELPDLPLEFVMRIKVNKGLSILKRGYKPCISKPETKNDSNLVWIVSYPRSGNTWLRIILNHNFGLKSYSIYNDTLDIGKHIEIAEVVGHQFMDWKVITGEDQRPAHSPQQSKSFDSLRYNTQNIKLVKSHSHYHKGFISDKVIYCYRDGRAALRSYASHRFKFDNVAAKGLSVLFDDILCGQDRFVLPWNQHIHSWKKSAHDNVLFLKFEDLLSDINSALKKISDFLKIQPIRTDIISFDKLHTINPDFFRKGQKKSWQDLFDDTRHALFWILNHEAMNMLGYDNEPHPVCEALMISCQNEKVRTEIQNTSVDHLKYFDNLLQQCAKILIIHISSIPDGNKQVIYYSFKKAHNKLLDYFHRWDSQGDHQSWVNEWKRVFMEFDTYGFE
ncbi:sulfotransferase domain-containing protein [Desulfobacter postgatei]|uniref:sulfotransferase domain-containing protein n=1 Tax=Desulfobacter postgatei TaxID=2293 RepID=UPI00259B7134|nr:sulfotransferase domain-containing protein [uncultured Desulfobacter sp.]